MEKTLMVAWLFTAALSNNGWASALVDLTVLEDRGGVSIDHYNSVFENSDLDDQPKENTQSLSDRFPIKTPSMSVGPIGADEANTLTRELTSMLTQPIFIVGFDPVSLDWLRKNKQFLLEKKAIGMVVNVDHQEQLDKMRALAPGVYLQAMPGEEISRQLNLKHYPFYVDSKGVVR